MGRSRGRRRPPDDGDARWDRGPRTAPDDGDAAAALVEDARLRALAAAPPPPGLPSRARRALDVATEAGAPTVAALDAVVVGLADERRLRRAVAVGAAQARAVAAGLVAIPLVAAPGVAWLADVDLAAFYGSGDGRIVLAVALGLLLAGASWLRATISAVGRTAAPAAELPRFVAVGLVVAAFAWRPAAGALAIAVLAVVSRRREGARAAYRLDEICDLVATALGGGLAPAAALRLVAARLDACAPALRKLAFTLEVGAQVEPPPGLERLAGLLVTSGRLGAPVADALRRLAADLRAERLADALAVAERLPVRLAFPTVLCLLPAGVLLVGAPLLVGGLANAGF